eukprot:4780939-Pleurochrysis_carterae.AAC.1
MLQNSAKSTLALGMVLQGPPLAWRCLHAFTLAHISLCACRSHESIFRHLCATCSSNTFRRRVSVGSLRAAACECLLNCRRRRALPTPRSPRSSRSARSSGKDPICHARFAVSVNLSDGMGRTDLGADSAASSNQAVSSFCHSCVSSATRLARTLKARAPLFRGILLPLNGLSSHHAYEGADVRPSSSLIL